MTNTHYLVLLAGLVLAVCVVPDSVQGDDSRSTIPTGWEQITPPVGASAYVIKVRNGSGVSYIFVRGGSRVIPTSVILRAGVRCDTLAQAASFAARRPSNVLLFPASKDTVDDDAQVLIEMSEDELKAIGIKPAEPGATDNPGDAQ